jgi:hypothetical protein
MGSPFFQHLAKSSQNQQIIQYNFKINYKLKMLLEKLIYVFKIENLITFNNVYKDEYKSHH